MFNNAMETSKNENYKEIANNEFTPQDDNDVLLDTPPKIIGGSLRDMLYNPVNANINASSSNNDNKFISTPSIKEIKNNAEDKQLETRKIENEVIKSVDKPIINVKPEEIKPDNNSTISDDEFFDDFFGD